jgi:cytochrome d ubiquinol oxidase subunit I
MHLLLFPDTANERNSLEMLSVPNMLSLMATHNPNGVVKGLKDFPKDERPPVLPVYLSFRLMVALGGLFLLIALLAVFLSWRNKLEQYPHFLKLLVFLIPLPYLANQLGWIVAEMGRQPWIVYGVLKTSAAVSTSISVSQVVASLIGFVLLYSLLGFVDIFLLVKFARKGPDRDGSGLNKPAGKGV